LTAGVVLFASRCCRLLPRSSEGAFPCLFIPQPRVLSVSAEASPLQRSVTINISSDILKLR
jgi:hypothetical protein